jgi:hypothetical protein
MVARQLVHVYRSICLGRSHSRILAHLLRSSRDRRHLVLAWSGAILSEESAIQKLLSSQFRDKRNPQHCKITLPVDGCFIEKGRTNNVWLLESTLDIKFGEIFHISRLPEIHLFSKFDICNSLIYH